MLVILGPRIKTRLRQALLHAACTLLDAGNGFGQLAQVLRRGHHARALQHQIIVIRGDAFKSPQLLGVLFMVQFVRVKSGRLDRFHIPCMKILVADEAEQLQILIAALFRTQTRQAPTVCHQGGRRSVFQAAINVVADVEHEHIMAKWRCAKQFNLRFANFFHIGQQAVFIKR